MAPVADDDDIDEDLENDDFGGKDPFEGDDDAARLDTSGSGDEDFDFDDGGGDDDDYDENETFEADEEDDRPRPIYLNPLLLTSVTLFLAVVGVVTWMIIGFDEAAYKEATGPVGQYATVPPPVLAQADPAPAINPPAPAAPDEPVAADEPVVADLGEPAPPLEPEPIAPAPVPPPAPEPAQPAPAPEVAPPPPPPPPPAVEPEPEPFEPDPAEALAVAPDPGLILQGQVGLLPVIGEDGRQPWHVYGRPVDLDEDIPKIAIVIGGLGMSEAATTAAIQQLPGTVTLAFVPYAPNLSSWIARARAAGHEVILQLPMEPTDFPANDPGPHTLMTEAEAAENIERLHWLLSRFTGYVGVTNYMGSRLTTSPDAMFPILQDLQARGLMFLDAMETPDSIAGQLAGEMNMPTAVNNRFLDTQASRVAIDARLFELEAIAEATGAAVGIGFPYPVTIERVAEWIATLEDREIAVVPISALAAGGGAPAEEDAAGGGH